jgi:glycosyltransferase involved in cell wall biosynthesis
MSAQGMLMEPSSNASTKTAAGTKLISVIVPVVERADDLMAVYQAFAGELDTRHEDYEFLFIFDGRFTPPPQLVEVARKKDSVRLLQFARAFGETAALRLGIEKSRGDTIITLPAYFQVQPEGIRLLLEAAGRGADMVVASRSPRLDSWLNRLQSQAFHSIVGSVSDQRFHDMACGVRLMRRPVAEALPLYGDLHRFIPALALREGFRVEEVSVPQHPGDARTRVYGPGVYLRRLLDIAAFFFLAKFTEKPLRFPGSWSHHERGADGSADRRPGHCEPPRPAARGALPRPRCAAPGTWAGRRDHRSPSCPSSSGVSGARAGLGPPLA